MIFKFYHSFKHALLNKNVFFQLWFYLLCLSVVQCSVCVPAWNHPPMAPVQIKAHRGFFSETTWIFSLFIDFPSYHALKRHKTLLCLWKCLMAFHENKADILVFWQLLCICWTCCGFDVGFSDAFWQFSCFCQCKRQTGNNQPLLCVVKLSHTG